MRRNSWPPSHLSSCRTHQLLRIAQSSKSCREPICLSYILLSSIAASSVNFRASNLPPTCCQLPTKRAPSGATLYLLHTLVRVFPNFRSCPSQHDTNIMVDLSRRRILDTLNSRYVYGRVVRAFLRRHHRVYRLPFGHSRTTLSFFPFLYCVAGRRLTLRLHISPFYMPSYSLHRSSSCRDWWPSSTPTMRTSLVSKPLLFNHRYCHD